MNTLFITYIVAMFLILFVVFLRMAITNKDEWFYTRYDLGLIVGAIPGLILGLTTGFIFFGINGFYLGTAIGLVAGAIAFDLNILIFNLKNREEIKKNK